MREYRLLSNDFVAYSDEEKQARRNLRPAFIAMGVSAALTAFIGYYTVKLLLVFL